MTSSTGGVQLPTNQQASIETLPEPSTSDAAAEPTAPAPPTPKQSAAAQSTVVVVAAAADFEERPGTPSTQDLPSEGALSTSPTTPASIHTTQESAVASLTPTQPTKSASKAAVPAVPVIPILPKSSPKDTRIAPSSEKVAVEQKAAESAHEQAADKPEETTAAEVPVKDESAAATIRVTPKSWASLVAGGLSTAVASTSTNSAAGPTANGVHAADGSISSDAGALPGFAKSNTSSQAEALHNFRVNSASKIAFLEPRGLINTGNMCYMNSVSLKLLKLCFND